METWTHLLEFAKENKKQNTLTVVFDADGGPGGEEGAWPYLIDEFVEYLYDKSIVEMYPAIWEK
ncbi:unnamed protein product [Brassica oleracea]